MILQRTLRQAAPAQSAVVGASPKGWILLVIADTTT